MWHLSKAIFAVTAAALSYGRGTEGVGLFVRAAPADVETDGYRVRGGFPLKVSYSSIIFISRDARNNDIISQTVRPTFIC